MSIRALALELYRAKQMAERLEEAHEKAPRDEKTALGQELKTAKNELEMLRRMLEGEKEAGSFRKRFQGFGSLKR